MKSFSLKSLFLFAVLFAALNLVACGDSSSSSSDEDTEDECLKDPSAAICQTPDAGDAGETVE